MAPAELADLRVSFERLRSDILALAAIGRGDDNALYRMAFSDADIAARRWLKERIDAASLHCDVDGAGNLFARLTTGDSAPSIMTGSHIDTVPGGGCLDGALGVLAGLECLRRIRESGAVLARPLELACFADEEGRFGNMLGSRAFAGALVPQDIVDAVDATGVRLEDAMAHHGLNAREVLSARRDPATVEAFVELHIEQGPVLESQNIDIGIVEDIVGLFRWRIKLIGAANHAGTTPMDARRDAFMGLCEIALGLPQLLGQHGSPRSVATIGSVAVYPGASNVVPGTVEFSLEVRDIHSDTLLGLGDEARHTISSVAQRRQLELELSIVEEIQPARCDPHIAQVSERLAASLGASVMRLHSGAAHDAQSLSDITRVGMIFIPSKGGVSHAPLEWSSWENIELGANVLLQTLCELAG